MALLTQFANHRRRSTCSASPLGQSARLPSFLTKLKGRFLLTGIALFMLASAAWAQGPTPATHVEDAAVAVAWFELLYDIVKAENLSPPVAARAYGVVGVALYEAVVPGSPSHQSLVGQLNGLAALPPPRWSKKYHWPAVANSTLATVLRQLFPGASANSRAAIDALEQRFARTFRATMPLSIFARSVLQGRLIADAVFDWAATDGYATLHNCPFTPPRGPGLWAATPPAFVSIPLQPCWGDLEPLVLTSGAECAPPPPPLYSEDPTSQFFLDAREVYETGNTLTPEQQTIARYWADGAGTTGTPPGHWVAIVGQIVEADDLSLVTAAEAYARVGLAVADAFITAWDTKYRYNLLRPVTYIREHIEPGWSPFIGTPPFPEYPSGHSVQSAAAATVLTDLFGERAFTDTTHSDHGLVPALAPRSFRSFTEAASEAALSRLYGGIHFRPAIDLGLQQGACVGQTILDRVTFKRERRLRGFNGMDHSPAYNGLSMGQNGFPITK